MFGWMKRFMGEKVEITAEAVPISTIIRWYMYDLKIKDANTLAKYFDLMPVSDEGEEKEREDSASRIARIAALLPYIEVYSKINAKAITMVQEEEILKLGVDKEDVNSELELLNIFYENISYSAIVSAISTAVELGLLAVNGTMTSVGDIDE